MYRDGFVKVDGTFKKVLEVHEKVDGSWEQMRSGHVKIQGNFKPWLGLNDQLVRITNWSSPLIWHAACGYAQDEVFVCGGSTSSVIANTSSSGTSACAKYNVRTDTILPLANMPQQRVRHDAVNLEDGRILVVGGSVLTPTYDAFSQSVWLYDIETNAWSVVASMPDKLRYASAMYHDGHVYVIGTRDNVGLAHGYRIYKYNVAANTWSTHYTWNYPSNGGNRSPSDNDSLLSFGSTDSLAVSWSIRKVSDTRIVVASCGIRLPHHTYWPSGFFSSHMSWSCLLVDLDIFVAPDSSSGAVTSAVLGVYSGTSFSNSIVIEPYNQPPCSLAVTELGLVVMSNPRIVPSVIQSYGSFYLTQPFKPESTSSASPIFKYRHPLTPLTGSVSDLGQSTLVAVPGTSYVLAIGGRRSGSSVPNSRVHAFSAGATPV